MTSGEGARTAEFDGFGPWVLQIRGYEDVPPLFRDGTYDPAASVLAMKFPRDIERRVAHPAMNLYDAMVDVRADGVVVHQRVGERAAVQRIPFADFRATRVYSRLLDGRYILFTRTDWLELRYSTASDKEIARLNATITDRMVAAVQGEAAVAGTAVTVPHTPNPAGVDYWFTSLHEAYLAAHPNAQLVAAQRRVRVGGRSIGLWRRLTSVFLPTQLSNALVYREADRVTLLQRASSVSRQRGTDFSLVRTVIPLRAIQRVTMHVSAQSDEVTLAVIDVGARQGLDIAFLAAEHQAANLVAGLASEPGPGPGTAAGPPR